MLRRAVRLRHRRRDDPRRPLRSSVQTRRNAGCDLERGAADLYKDGLQRHASCRRSTCSSNTSMCVSCAVRRDYRLRQLTQAGTYLPPGSGHHASHLQGCFTSLPARALPQRDAGSRSDSVRASKSKDAAFRSCVERARRSGSISWPSAAARAARTTTSRSPATISRSSSATCRSWTHCAKMKRGASSRSWMSSTTATSISSSRPPPPPAALTAASAACCSSAPPAG